ncbi:hypothetical protein Cfor_10790 [Coptotermes formosanus]|uniref:Uncharacterized protein n=1 Tax=Coptotermes formosanus TaxID=36987 RepID=A0A6L2PU59_COPFO|nr:hypothetical protein Cfor_10790 [Coptotermes formosanus]
MPFRLFIKINLWAQNTIFLGLEIDEHLNWKKHIEEILPKLRSASYAVRSVYYTSSIATLKMICFAYFCLKLQNGIILWGTSTDENDVCYLILAEKNYSKRLAFSYLEDLAQEFHTQYGKKVNTVTRPYSFIEFDTYIQKAKKVFTDSRARRNLSALNTELQDVQRIMVQNIDDVLQRGVVLSELDTKAQNLSILSQKYKKDATFLNTKSMYMKAAVACIAFLVVFLYFWVL